MSALFAHGWLADTAAAVTLLIALVLVLRGPVSQHFGPNIAYALWLLPLARAVMPGITLTVEVPAVAPQPTAIAAMDAAQLAATSAFDWSAMLLAIWLAGALLLAGHALLAYVRLRRAIAADASLIDIIDNVAIVQSDAVDGPVAVGVFSPMVVLPRDFSATFTPVQQRQVIAHELEHHRGGDLLINLPAFALLTFNWFNPLVWAGWRAFRQDQEAACDGRTLDRLGVSSGRDRASYGRTIAVAVAGPALRPSPTFALAMGEKSALIHRLRSLSMTNFTPRRIWLGRATLAATALLVLPLTASVSYAIVQANPPVAPAPPQPPATPEAPVAPLAPLAPLSPDIDMTAGLGEHVQRIERGGRTIILHTNRAMSDAEVERLVAVAEGSRAAAEHAAGSSADAEQHGRHRIVIRTHGAGDALTVVPPAPPVPPADGERRTDRRIVMVDRAAVTVRCSANTDSPSGSWQSEDGQRVNVVNCTETPAALRLQAVRSARAALVAMSEAQLPAERRRSALAELDEIIATLERDTAN